MPDLMMQQKSDKLRTTIIQGVGLQCKDAIHHTIFYADKAKRTAPPALFFQPNTKTQKGF